MAFMFNRWNIITRIQKCHQPSTEWKYFFFSSCLNAKHAYVHQCKYIYNIYRQYRTLWRTGEEGEEEEGKSFSQTFLDYLVFSVFLASKSFSTSKMERDKLKKCRAERWQICQLHFYVSIKPNLQIEIWETEGETELIWLWHLTYNNGIHCIH